jgi:magnesium transporter
MPVAAARRYTSGMCSQTELAIDGDPRVSLPEGCFDWVGVAEPTSQEMELLRIQFGLHRLAVEDALSGNQLSKAEVFGKQLS